MSTTTKLNDKGGPLVLPVSLRDYFAAKAMQGFCTGGTRGDPIKSLADLSYMMADAMLAAREKAGVR